MPLLPSIRTREQYRSSPRDEATYAPAVREICRRHALPDRPACKFAGGSTIVFAVGEAHVVKLFEPVFAEAADTEAAVLVHVHGRLGVPTPGLLAAGELEGWRYLVMERLHGLDLHAAWEGISPSERASLCRGVGEAVARQHALPTASLALPGPAWPAFLRRRVEGCVEHQRAHGVPERWLAQIPGFLATVDLAAPGRVLLHTEVMREHVLVRRAGGAWVISGLLDFEPAMVGAPEYELASVGIFLAGGDPTLFRAFLLGYGCAGPRLTPALRRRVMAYALLHRYSNLRWYLERLPPRAAATLEGLADEWFAFD